MYEELGMVSKDAAVRHLSYYLEFFTRW